MAGLMFSCRTSSDTGNVTVEIILYSEIVFLGQHALIAQL